MKRKTSVVEEPEEQESEKYSSEKYWNDRYIAGGNHTWYYEYEDLEPLLSDLVGRRDTVVEIGCGDAPLLTGMAAARDRDRGTYGDEETAEEKEVSDGRLIGVDFSRAIIDTLKKDQSKLGLSKGAAASLSYHCVDARDLSSLFPRNGFNTTGERCLPCTSSSASDHKKARVDTGAAEEGCVDLVIDKGTMDAMLCGNNDEGQEEGRGYANVRAMLSEALRVTRRNSAYMLISHMQHDSDTFQEVLRECFVPALDDQQACPWARTRQWELEVHIQEQQDTGTGTDSSGEDEAGGDSEDEEEGTREAPPVYILRSRERRQTRTAATTAAPLLITVHEH
jgi:hypothetical protein